LLRLRGFVRIGGREGTVAQAMQREFWLARWGEQQIGFHQMDVNPWLRRCWHELALPPGSPVFVPLCGKSLDMVWLAEQGHPVVGVELAEEAVRAFFHERGRHCRAERERHLQRYAGGDFTLYCGDFMDLTTPHLQGVKAVYDRAALIALPPRMRGHYVDHLLRIIRERSRILLLTLEYDQSLVAGPPHCVEESEVRALYGPRCRIERLYSEPAGMLPPKFAEAGVEDAIEVVYRLTKES